MRQSDQRTLGWYRERLGYITGSRVGDLMKKGRTSGDAFSQTAMSYIYQLAGERMFNAEILDSDDYFQEYLDATEVSSKAMRFGTEQEPFAKSLFMRLRHPDKEMIEVGSCRHDKIDFFSASPDGIIRNIDGNGNMRIVEVKCPSIDTYMMYRSEIHDSASLLRVRPQYYWQMMAEMDCTPGTVDGEFVTYCPWLSCPIHSVVIHKDEASIAEMEKRVMMANGIIDKIIGL